MEGFLIVGFVVALIATVIGLVLFLGKKRQEALQAIAQQLNFQFFPKGNSSLNPFLANLDFFSHGSYRRVRNLMQGKVMRQGKSVSVAIFDYYYTIGRRDNTDTLGQTVVLFYDPSLQVPSFSLRPEHLIDKLGNLLGAEDINFPQFPGFSKRYRLLSSQPGPVRSLFQPNVLKFYEGQKICTEAQGNYVVIFPSDDGSPRSHSIHMKGAKTYTESRLIQPSELKSHLDIGLRLLNLLERNLA